MLRFYSAIPSSSCGFLAERKSIRKHRIPDIRCFYRDMEIFGSITHGSFLKFSCTHCLLSFSMIGGTDFRRLRKPYIVQRGRLAAQSSFCCGLVGQVGTGLVLLDRIENEKFSVKESHKQQIPEELDNVPSSNLQSRFKISELKLQFLEERDAHILSERILSLSKSNKVRSALELYLSMDIAGLRTTAHACNSLLACLIRNRYIDDAMVVFEMMRKKGLPTGHTYSLVLKAVADSQGYKPAMEIFSSLEDEGVSKHIFDIIVYNTMISICGKVKNWVETDRIWRKFKQNNLNGTMITYSLLISTFVQCGISELALEAYHEMITKGLVPDEDIMKAIVASCTKDGKWDLAFNMLRKMLESGIKPTVITYNSVINCLGKAGKEALAFKVYEFMKLSGMKADACTWSALLNGLYTSKRYADVLRLFESFRALSASTSYCQLYNIALMSCQRLGLWERSLQLLWQMENNGMEISTKSYNYVIRACETARKPDVALQVYQHMIDQKQTPDTFTYLSLIRACIWGSLWTKVENILEVIPVDASLYNALVQGFCLRGKILLARQMYRKMRSIGLKSDGKTRAMMLQHLPVMRHIR
ncbi:pentatricopeptide repeat-containing protein At3g29290 [Phalaenopsis equestris]|uniref:pentatricopeptide repeat-containing protein At3g29290 n=1 Tax=Phalaenopsis equestris TaxID=78828 RepID=UPI0009E5F94A|nr:pentatricopeptide repeat-containing protein At3g29290 [Phalaenopsis equestris]XP_020582171.1 pentatricopeptide repeat-containing protein At3g29290 [Phalaenopsis equestris]